MNLQDHGQHDAESLGRFARNLPGFRVLPGMRLVHEDGTAWRVCANGLDVCADERWMVERKGGGPAPHLYRDCWPDPEDPGTVGCLLKLLGRGARFWQDREDELWTVEAGIIRCSMHRSLGAAIMHAAVARGCWAHVPIPVPAGLGG